MPEILRRGRLTPERVIGLALRCGRCTSEFRIVDGDAYQLRYARTQLDSDAVTIACPVCKSEVVQAVPPPVVTFPRT